MKKIISLIFITILSLFTFGFIHPRAATFTPEPSASVGGLWHVEDGNQAYVYMRYAIGSTAVETGSHYDHYSTWWMGYEADYSFNTATPKSAVLDNPDPLVYTKFNVEIIGNVDVISGPNPEVIDVLDTTDVDRIEIRITDWDQRPNTNYLYDYSFFDLYVDGIKILTSRNIDAGVSQALGFPVNPYYSKLTFAVRMYWSRPTETIIDPEDPDPWDDLPLTTGNPTNVLGDWGDVTEWSFDALTGEMDFTINYLQNLYFINDLMIAGDTEFIEKVESIHYFTDPITDDRILYMNFSDEEGSFILKETSREDVSIWKGEALWNLSQGEVKVLNVMRVFNYIPEISSNGLVESYFYMPDVPVEDLLSVTVNLGYRYYEKEYFWSLYQPGPIRFKTITLTKGETTSVNPPWVENVYQASFWTSGVTAALMVLGTPLGKVPKLGWGIAAASFVIGGLFLVADSYEFFAYDVSQIQYVIPDSALRDEIDTYIQSKDPTAEPIDITTNKLYKLTLGQLNDGENPQVLDDYSNVVQIVWETDGEIYSVEEEYIEDDWGGPGTDVPDTGFTLEGLWDAIKGPGALILAIILVIFVLPRLEKTIGSFLRIITDWKKLVVLLIVVLVILMALGVVPV